MLGSTGYDAIFRCRDRRVGGEGRIGDRNRDGGASTQDDNFNMDNAP